MQYFQQADETLGIPVEQWQAMYVSASVQLAAERDNIRALETILEKTMREKQALIDFIYNDAKFYPCHIYSWKKTDEFPAYCGAAYDEGKGCFTCKFKESSECLARFATYKASESLIHTGKTRRR